MVELVNDLIRRAYAARASDVHFEPLGNGVRSATAALGVRFRVDGLLYDIEELPAAVTPNVLSRIKTMAGLPSYRNEIPLEGSVLSDSGELPCGVRVSTISTIRGERVVLRLMEHTAKLISLDELGHDPALVERLKNLVMQPQGLILVCGPVGSGKTTTVHAMLEHILSQERRVSILSIEDPVEIRHDGVTQVEVNVKRGLTYSIALRGLLRQDPQVLMVGEVRDAEVARLVFEAALTGHLVLTSMHSGSPTEAIVRLQEMGIPPYQLTSTLQAILAQRLVRVRCTNCEECTPQEGRLECIGEGYAGRTAIGQCVEMSAALREAILAGADVADLSQPHICPISLRADAQRLVDAGRTRVEEVVRVLGPADISAEVHEAVAGSSS